MLLKSTDGFCNSWQQFMISTLGVQGIAATRKSVSVSGYDLFKIKPSLTGQGGVTPKEFIFDQHVFVGYNGKAYDPSYGVCYGLLANNAYMTSFMARVESAGTGEELTPPFEGHSYAYVAQITY